MRNVVRKLLHFDLTMTMCTKTNVKRLSLTLSCLLLPMSCAQSNTQIVTVFAASSLQDAFQQMSSEFVKSNPEFEVRFSFNSSTQLSQQILDGAPADVFAAADTENMDLVVLHDEIVGDPSVFAANRLEILVALSAVERVHSLVDLSRPDVVVVLAAADVPLGRLSTAVLTAADVAVSPVSYEPSASAVVSKIVDGEADAGIVYSSDVVRAGRAAFGVEIPPTINLDVLYPIAVTRHGAKHSGAKQWVSFVLSKRGQEILHQHGFSKGDN